MVVGILFNVLSSYCFGYSAYSALGVVYQIQVFMLLPLTEADIGEDVIDFFRLLSDVLLSFKFLPSEFVFFGFSDSIFSYFHFEQPHSYLYVLRFRSGSSFVNLTDFFWGLISVGAVFAVVAPAYSCTRDQEPDSNRHKFFRRVFHSMVSKLFMRLFLVAYVFLCIAGLSEVMSTDRVTEGPASYAFACAVSAA